MFFLNKQKMMLFIYISPEPEIWCCIRSPIVVFYTFIIPPPCSIWLLNSVLCDSHPRVLYPFPPIFLYLLSLMFYTSFLWCFIRPFHGQKNLQIFFQNKLLNHAQTIFFFHSAKVLLKNNFKKLNKCFGAWFQNKLREFFPPQLKNERSLFQNTLFFCFLKPCSQKTFLKREKKLRSTKVQKNCFSCVG